MKKQDIEKDNKVWYIISLLCFYILCFFYNIINKELTKTKYITFMQFVKFGIVGLSNTIIAYIIYGGMLFLFERIGWFSDVDYLIASFFSFVLSVLWSFYWNSKKVFVVKEGEERKVLPALIKTFISYSFSGLILGNILLIIWVRVFSISKYIAPLINLIVTIPMNFIINKFWAFKTKKAE